ncbi:hypothetical protein [Sandarakinorhabdus sp. DWP1-3-1]
MNAKLLIPLIALMGVAGAATAAPAPKVEKAGNHHTRTKVEKTGTKAGK